MKFIFATLLLAVSLRTSLADCVLPSNIGRIVVAPSQSSYGVWSMVSLSCPEGYTSFGPEYSYCTDRNTWDPVPSSFRCLAQCKAPKVGAGVLHFPLGQTPAQTQETYADEAVILYACANGESSALIGANEATCFEGVWEPALTPICAQCSPPPVSDTKIVQISPKRESYPANSKVSLSCPNDVMFTPKGTSVTYCDTNGEWQPDPSKMKCVENCMSPEYDANVLTYPQFGSPGESKSVYGFNEIIRNTCTDGKTLVGPREQRCVSGVWLPRLPVVCH